MKDLRNQARALAIAYSKSADLSPPLGYPGGLCQVMDRAHENVGDIGVLNHLVDKVEEGEDLSNPEAARIYKTPELERGINNYPKFISSIKITSHTQYRMDQRGVTVSEIRLFLSQFAKAFHDGKSTNSRDFKAWSEAISWGEPIKWTSKSLSGLTVVFTIESGVANIVTAYWSGLDNPYPVSEEECGYPSAGRVAGMYLASLEKRSSSTIPSPGYKTFVSPKSEMNLPSDIDIEHQQVLPLPGSATPGGAGRDIPKFEYNTPGIEPRINPRTLGVPGEEYGHPVKFDYGMPTRRGLEASGANLFWEDDLYDFEGDPWSIARSSGINILRGKEFKAGFEVDGEIVAVLFDESDSDEYSFDIAVKPEHRRSGLASKLLDLALEAYEENRFHLGDGYKLSLDVVSPDMERLLLRRGFFEVGRDGGHVLMTRSASPSIGGTVLMERRAALRDSPLSVIREYLSDLFNSDEEAFYEMSEDSKSIAFLSRLIGDADEYLTDKRRPSDSSYAKDARDLLEGGSPVVHLSDGGYSRLTLSIFDPPHMWIDREVSTPKVVERWDHSRKAHAEGDTRHPRVPEGQRRRSQPQDQRERRHKPRNNREAKTAGDIIMYDQHNPANNEVNQPDPTWGTGLRDLSLMFEPPTSRPGFRPVIPPSPGTTPTRPRLLEGSYQTA
jgi:ribosomal protein S18 acetylase RimI-like enzyme